MFTLCGDVFGEITPSGLMNLSRMDRIMELELDANKAVDDQVIIRCVTPRQGRSQRGAVWLGGLRPCGFAALSLGPFGLAR